MKFWQVKLMFFLSHIQLMIVYWYNDARQNDLVTLFIIAFLYPYLPSHLDILAACIHQRDRENYRTEIKLLHEKPIWSEKWTVFEK